MQNEHEVRRASIDPDRLLPGEDTNSNDPNDAQHWIAVYEELRGTKLQVIANLRELMERQSQDAQDELERADIRMLQMQIERFDKRIAVWRAKLDPAMTENAPHDLGGT